MRKLGFYSLGTFASIVCLLGILSGCHKNTKDSKPQPVDPSATEVSVAPLPPEQTCEKTQREIIPMIEKSLCANPSSDLCLRFKAFMQAGLPQFSPDVKFAVGSEVTVPLQGKAITADDGRDYMILVIDQKKDMPLSLGLTDVRTANDDQDRAMKSYIHNSMSQDSTSRDASTTSIENVIQRQIDTTFFPLTPPQACPNWLYFPLTYIHDRPSEVIVRKQGSMYYILALLYSPKREELVNAYFSYAPEPYAGSPTSTTTPAPVTSPVPPLAPAASTSSGVEPPKPASVGSNVEAPKPADQKDNTLKSDSDRNKPDTKEPSLKVKPSRKGKKKQK